MKARHPVVLAEFRLCWVYVRRQWQGGAPVKELARLADPEVIRLLHYDPAVIGLLQFSSEPRLQLGQLSCKPGSQVADAVVWYELSPPGTQERLGVLVARPPQGYCRVRRLWRDLQPSLPPRAEGLPLPEVTWDPRPTGLMLP